MTDNRERQRAELVLLESMYPDEFSKVSDANDSSIDPKVTLHIESE